MERAPLAEKVRLLSGEKIQKRGERVSDLTRSPATYLADMLLFQPTPLDVEILTTIECFTKYLGLWYNHHTVESPELIFKVDYFGGSRGVIRCGSWIPGRPDSIPHHFEMLIKISRAKEMVPWESLGARGQVKKEEMLRIFMEYRANEGCSVLLPHTVNRTIT